jgi:antitoxin MazE
MSSTAKLFMDGDDQAVCLPDEFRFDGTEVRISKVGDKVILEPLEKQGDESSIVAAGDGVVEVESKETQRRRALDRLAERNWTLPPDYKFDRDEANER